MSSSNSQHHASASAAEADLRELYESDPDFFTSPPRYRVRWWRTGDTLQEGTGWVAELAGSPNPEVILQRQGFLRESALPDALLTLAKLADYLGPELARQAGEMTPGGFYGPVEARSALPDHIQRDVFLHLPCPG